MYPNSSQVKECGNGVTGVFMFETMSVGDICITDAATKTTDDGSVDLCISAGYMHIQINFKNNPVVKIPNPSPLCVQSTLPYEKAIHLACCRTVALPRRCSNTAGRGNQVSTINSVRVI